VRQAHARARLLHAGCCEKSLVPRGKCSPGVPALRRVSPH